MCSSVPPLSELSSLFSDLSLFPLKLLSSLTTRFFAGAAIFCSSSPSLRVMCNNLQFVAHTRRNAKAEANYSATFDLWRNVLEESADCTHLVNVIYSHHHVMVSNTYTQADTCIRTFNFDFSDWVKYELLMTWLKIKILLLRTWS